MSTSFPHAPGVISILHSKREGIVIKNDGARSLAWVVGNSLSFNKLGACSTGWTAKRLKTDDENDSYPLKLMTRMVSLAGLLHDIGKANRAFQSMIRGDSGAEKFRHEAVSVMMLSWLSASVSDVEWIEKFIFSAENQTLHLHITESLKKEASQREGLIRALSHNGTADHDSCTTDTGYSNLPFCETTNSSVTPVAFGLMWLISSHHRLPSGEAGNSVASINTRVHVRLHDSEAVGKTVSSGLPWSEASWLKRLVSDLQSLKSLVADEKFIGYKPHFFDHLRLFARPAFQLADHLISSNKLVDPRQLADYAYANTVGGEHKGSGRQLGQKLHSHLIAVSRKARLVVHELLTLRENLPSLTKEEIPSTLRKKTPIAEFDWQNSAISAIRTNRQSTNTGENAFFGVLIAGLGSGKTFTGLKILAAFPGDMRVIYTSPLRSLTLQAGTMFGGVGFQPDDLAVIIGDTLVRKMYDVEESKKESSKANAAIDENDQESLEISGGFCPESLKDKIQSFGCLDSRAMKMVATPVLSATLDTVMKLADGRRGSYLTHLLRIASSDIVIDEADMYSPADLIAIGRLVEAIGFWRSKLILSSGTLSPIISAAFFKAYKSGLDARDALDEKSTNLSAGWFSNSVPPKIKTIKTLNGNEQYLSENSKFALVVSQKISELSSPSMLPKRKVGGYIHRYDLSLPGAGRLKKSDGANAFEILACAMRLHDKTSINLSSTKTLSFGCIQVVNVKHCQKISVELCNQVSGDYVSSKDFDFRVICLHGRLSLASRNEIETHLNIMLSRKGNNGDLAPLKNIDALNFINNSSAKKIMIILVSTMETTGRDHDFDWGIIESRQERDIIQFSGRIRRHRPALTGDAIENIVIWNSPLSWNGMPWDANPRSSPFARYGVADVINNDIASPHLNARATADKNALLKTSIYGRLPLYSEMMELTYKDRKPVINSSRVLLDMEMSPLESKGSVAYTVRACETERLRSALLQVRRGKTESLAEWLEPTNNAGRLLTTHPDKYRFRSSRKLFCYWVNKNGFWSYVENPQKFSYDGEFSNSVSYSSWSFNTEGLLFSFKESEVISKIQHDTGMAGVVVGFRLSCLFTNEIRLDSIFHHCQIGIRQN